MNIWKLMPVIAVIACASSEQIATTPQPVVTTPAVVAIDPVGSYEFSTTVDGQAVTGTLTIGGTAGAYTGRIVTNMFPEIPVTGAKVEDKTVIATGSMPDGELTIRMLMDGMNFTGRWELGGDTGEFNGKKLPK
jgi:hypothetical protein